MSTHSVDVIKIKLEPHPNADTLSVVRVKSYTVVVRTSDWKDGDLAAYIEPDYFVPASNPQFSFLAAFSSLKRQNDVEGYRIKCKRLRNVMSMGLLVPAPEGSKEGDNVMEIMKVQRYEPQISGMNTGGEACAAPPGVYYKYDVESGYRYPDMFKFGEEVIITEKIHGANGRFVYIEGDGMYCSSHTEWKRQSDTNLWWKALYNTPSVEDFCRRHPGYCVYGEVYGNVQDLKYGCKAGEVYIAVFDILCGGYWIHPSILMDMAGYAELPKVPSLYNGPWKGPELAIELARGKSVQAGLRGAEHIREGVVVKALKEHWDPPIPAEYPHRRQLKYVSMDYLERA